MAKTLVAFFSATGSTRSVAKALAEATSADLFSIDPRRPYNNADLNWRDPNSRSSVEMKDESARPEMRKTIENMADYDTVFLGFPIWWYVEPRIIDTFLEAHDFSNKKIVAFATSGGSGLGEAPARMQALAPTATIVDGGLLNGKQTPDALKSWSEAYL